MKRRLMRIADAFLAAVILMSGLSCVPMSATELDMADGIVKSAEKTKKTKKTKIEKAKDKAVLALLSRLKEEREKVYVYKDYGLSENHYTVRSRLYGGNSSSFKDLDENWQKNPYSGTSCIRCEQTIQHLNWVCWLFENGRYTAGNSGPSLNSGKTGGQGLDLTGADALHFYARAEKADTKVEFFASGYGYDGSTNEKLADHPDSSTKISLGWVELTEDWKEYVIPLTGKDISYVVDGFGYVIDNWHNDDDTYVFYLDEIYFSGKIKSVKNAPVLLRSYDTDDVTVKNTAFSYDNALVALALISEGKKSEAKSILNAFIYAINNDRAYLYGKTGNKSKRLRNAYAAGDISAFPGWESGARLPGWYDLDKNMYIESQTDVGIAVGNISYVAIAMLQYYNRYGGKKYLKTACTLMDWVIRNCSKDGYDGFTAGFDGSEEEGLQYITENTYRSTEMNLDALAAFSLLAEITGKTKYKNAAASAERFVRSMYDEESGLFCVGTTADVQTKNNDVIVLDTQVLSGLVLGDKFEPYKDALKTVEKMNTKDGGYTFCLGDEKTVWWPEGTSFTALLYKKLGDESKYTGIMKALASVQLKNGLLPAATGKHLFTGIYLSDGSRWEYSDDAHIAPTSWMIMAANGFNPFTLDN